MKRDRIDELEEIYEDSVDQAAPMIAKRDLRKLLDVAIAAEDLVGVMALMQGEPKDDAIRRAWTQCRETLKALMSHEARP